MKRKKKEYLECAAFTVPSLFLVMLVFYIPFVMSLYYTDRVERNFQSTEIYRAGEL